MFQGRIVVAKGADGTDARMRHSALILSEGAEIDAKPELEIYADDVQCAHGNTIGALDEEVLFYVRSRGVPEAEARALLTEAHLGEVVERIEHEGAREAVRAFVASKLADVVPWLTARFRRPSTSPPIRGQFPILRRQGERQAPDLSRQRRLRSEAPRGDRRHSGGHGGLLRQRAPGPAHPR